LFSTVFNRLFNSTHENTVVIVLHNILLLHTCDNENSTVAHAIRHTKLAEHATY